MSDAVGNPSGAISKEIVLQLAVRAVRKVHLEAQLLSLGHLDDEPKHGVLRGVNLGSKGVATAPESAVRDALWQEFNSSKLAHGWKVRSGEEASSTEASARWFGVMDREVTFRIEQEPRSIPRVDLVYRRVPGPGDKTSCDYSIAPLELKRAERLRLNHSSGQPERGGHLVGEVQKDVRQLARMVRASRTRQLRIDADIELPLKNRCARFTEDIYPHILVWGSTRPEKAPPSPEAFLGGVFDDDVARCGCRPKTDKDGNRVTKCEWVPVDWTGWRPSEEPRVTEWLWIVLEELEVSDNNGCTGRECSCQLVPER
jgi:hypothetical protein